MSVVPGILALGFASPLLLWGVLFAAAPVVIHLLLRRQYRETPWAAMQFLLAASQRRSRWSRIDQWLLLLVRTLIPLAAALALAGPLLDLATGAAASLPTHRVLVLDVSLSTQVQEDGRSRWSRMRDAAAALANEARPGDTWQLFAIGGATPQAIISDPTFLNAPVLEELRRLEATTETGSFADGLRLVAESLGTQSHGRRLVYIFTDGQRAQWRPASENQRDSLQKVVAELDGMARVIWTDVSTSSLGNVALGDLALAEPYVLVGQPVRATATVRRFGDAPWPNTLEWRVDGRLVAAQPLSNSAAHEIRSEWQYIPSTAGELRIEASLAADPLPVDDRRNVICIVRDTVRVLLVDGRPSGVPFKNATDCVRLALAPTESTIRPGRIEPTVIPDGQLLAMRVEDYDVVWLCDVPRLTDREGELLARYVRDGGGLVFSLGPGVLVDTYNATLLREDRPLLPARIGDIVGDPRLRDQAFVFQGDDFSHPIVAPFRGNPNTGYELTQTFAYRRTFPTEQARVAVAFETGDAAIVEGEYGRGHVLLVTTAVDRTWGTWAVWGHTFVPMVHETIRYLISRQLESRQRLVGEPLMASLPQAAATGTILVVKPGNERVEAPAGHRSSSSPVVFDETEQPGFYAIDPAGTSNPVTWFAVNPDPSESDLTPLSTSELRDGLFSGRNIETADDVDDAAIATSSSTNSAADDPSARWLLGLVLVLLIGEPFLAWNRPLGTYIILSLAVAAMCGVWGGGLAATVAAIVVSMAGILLFFRQPWPRETGSTSALP